MSYNRYKIAHAQFPKWVEVVVRDESRSLDNVILCPDQDMADKVAKALDILFNLDGARSWARRFLDDSESGSQGKTE